MASSGERRTSSVVIGVRFAAPLFLAQSTENPLLI